MNLLGLLTGLTGRYAVGQFSGLLMGCDTITKPCPTATLYFLNTNTPKTTHSQNKDYIQSQQKSMVSGSPDLPCFLQVCWQPQTKLSSASLCLFHCHDQRLLSFTTSALFHNDYGYAIPGRNSRSVFIRQFCTRIQGTPRRWQKVFTLMSLQGRGA